MHDEECLKGQDRIGTTCFQIRDTGVDFNLIGIGNLTKVYEN